MYIPGRLVLQVEKVTRHSYLRVNRRIVKLECLQWHLEVVKTGLKRIAGLGKGIAHLDLEEVELESCISKLRQGPVKNSDSDRVSVQLTSQSHHSRELEVRLA